MSDFHFLRPWWLLGLLPAVLLVWQLWRASDSSRAWRKVISPHLLPYLLVGVESRKWLSPIPILIAGWILAVIASSGPAWKREPAPFADDVAGLVIVMKVTPSMLTQDIQPTRLARAVEKIHDLTQLRPGAKTALIAYSGSAHRVMPLTSDAGIINSFAGDLAPNVMPVEGDVADAALDLANQIITKSGQRGWVLWITDTVAADQLKGLADYREKGGAPVTLLAMSTGGPELESLQSAATALGGDLIRITPDNADVQQASRNTRFSSAAESTTERWRDAGYWLVPLLAALNLLWFRSGWVARGGAA